MNTPSIGLSHFDPTPNFSSPDAYTSDLRPSWHQLLIVGNGFDLECGLKSSFGDFIKARNEAFDHHENDGDTNPLGFRRNLWDVILGKMDEPHWADVENAIEKWVVPDCLKKESSHSADSLLDKTLYALSEIGKDDKNSYSTDSLVDTAAHYLCGGSPKEVRQWTKASLLNLSRHDLDTLECDFSSYLDYAIKQKADYRKNARKLICELILYGRPSDEDYDIEGSVLSFNYTRPVETLHSEEHAITYVNIHGRLGGEIVFGIDGTGLMDNTEIMPFTKTYRLMSLDVEGTGSLVHVPPTVGYQDYGTSLIKFYGHSLSRADYSYFQAIFDAVHLYEGHTQLIFFYRAHSGKSSHDARVETMRQVIRLLAAYGDTLDNKDHGKNLISDSLDNEGR